MEYKKLNLGHILPYFKYGLFIYSNEYDEVFRLNQINDFGDFKLWIHNSDDFNKKYLIKENLTGLAFMLDDVKPLLKPIEEILNNEEDLNSITIHSRSVIEMDLENKEFIKLSESELFENILYNDIKYLFSKHYDVFDLISENLAIKKES